MRLLLPVLLFSLVSAQAFAQPAQFTDKADEIPDFLQTDSESGFEDSGSQYCAPTSVSNSLMWLAGHGYERLKPQADSAKGAQAKMIRTLASHDYMNTNTSTGTSPFEVMDGVRKYLQDCHCSIERLEYHGWRTRSEEAGSTSHPDLKAIKAALANPRAAVWLNVGWYAHEAGKNEYARDGGHWVTAVGYQGDTILVHDPSPRAGAEFWTQDVTVEKLDSGQLTGDNANLPQPAGGYFHLGGEMKLPDRADTCVLDGVVILVLGAGSAPATSPASGEDEQ